MKKLMSSILVVVMMVFMMPVSTFAADSAVVINSADVDAIKSYFPAGAVDVKESSGIITISFLRDYQNNITFDVGGTFVIDGNGYTLGDFTTGPTINVSGASIVTLLGGATYKNGVKVNNTNAKLIIKDARILKGNATNSLEKINGEIYIGTSDTTTVNKFMINNERKEKGYPLTSSIDEDVVVVPIKSEHTTNVNYHVSDSNFTVTIPPTATLGDTEEVKVENVTVESKRAVFVKILYGGEGSSGQDFKLKTARGAELTYNITNESGDKYSIGDSVLRVDKGNGSTNLTFSNPTSDVSNSGSYTGIVTFGISVEDDNWNI